MDHQQLMHLQHHCLMKMQKAFMKYHHWNKAFQHYQSIMQQPFLQFNPNTHLNVSPVTQINPDLNVSPFTQVNPHLEINPQTQINPKLFSDIEVSPHTQAYFNFDPDLHLNFGGK